MRSRIIYIDSLRGAAVIFMVQQHLLVWLWNKKWISYSITFPEHPVMLTLNFIGNFAAPLFLLLAGTGAAILYSGPEAGRSPVMKEFLKRGIFILLCGYALNLLSPHWFRPGSWYILHTIGISIIVAPLLLMLSTAILSAIASVTLILPAFIQTWMTTPLMTGDSFMNDVSRYGGVLRLALAEGHFPLFPWIAFFIAGIICFRWVKEGRRNYILFAGTFSLAAGFMLKAFYNYGYFFATGGRFFRIFVFTPYIYPAHPSLILMLLGTAMILLFLFSFIQEESCLPAFTAATGRLSLTWFFIHIIIFNEIFRLYGIHRIFSSAGTILFISASISVIILISHLWQKAGFRFSIEWFMRRVLKLQ